MNTNIGNHIRRFINGWCPSCDESSSLAPGSLSEDETIEYRTCVDCGATVEDDDSRFWANDADADEDGIS
ncbi:hypothetical protein [Brevibacterium aurantiacum]|uniref:Uncharacterized protein n=1 Tax=Brevibacterium aurantiacum TaxID=273384 RepID=A0A1D7VZ38_BREAU|nr:hypothetical protein [Brevibacterium aurantiacum]AOP52099.1 hypothetical protein BLSMQ_0381 [Brevibacterium aurantiacum]PCC52547.1 hypothetical protein CIK59_15735 [Brevibacterium aurantiacum]RCS98665.1 hypothetical protein CIK60_09020 [Brevibacterium aurantiacum]